MIIFVQVKRAEKVGWSKTKKRFLQYLRFRQIQQLCIVASGKFNNPSKDTAWLQDCLLYVHQKSSIFTIISASQVNLSFCIYGHKIQMSTPKSTFLHGASDYISNLGCSYNAISAIHYMRFKVVCKICFGRLSTFVVLQKSCNKWIFII